MPDFSYEPAVPFSYTEEAGEELPLPDTPCTPDDPLATPDIFPVFDDVEHLTIIDPEAEAVRDAFIETYGINTQVTHSAREGLSVMGGDEPGRQLLLSVEYAGYDFNTAMRYDPRVHVRDVLDGRTTAEYQINPRRDRLDKLRLTQCREIEVECLSLPEIAPRVLVAMDMLAAYKQLPSGAQWLLKLMIDDQSCGAVPSNRDVSKIVRDYSHAIHPMSYSEQLAVLRYTMEAITRNEVV